MQKGKRKWITLPVSGATTPANPAALCCVSHPGIRCPRNHVNAKDNGMKKQQQEHSTGNHLYKHRASTGNILHKH